MTITLALTLWLVLASYPAYADGSSSYIDGLLSGARGASLDISNTGIGDNASIVVRFFHAIGCPHCAIIEPHIDSLEGKYPEVEFLRLEISRNSTNYALYQELNDRFNVTNRVVPSVFLGERALIGEEAIRTGLEPAIIEILEAINNEEPGDEPGDDPTNNTGDAGNGQDNSTAGGDDPGGSADSNDTAGTIPSDGPGTGGIGRSNDLTIAMVIVAAAADSINPCAISVMIFLLLFLTSLGDKRKVTMVGLVYIATVYLVYFIAGLGLLTFLQSTAMTRMIYYGAGVVSIAIGLINIKDFIFFKDKSTMAIPESKKPTIKKYIEKATIPAAVVLGVLVSLFELPCTGGIYFAILNLLSNSMTFSEGVPWLALYNLIYVLPLAIILGVILAGVSAERANSWRLENRRGLRLILGLVMLLIGAMMLLGML
jgi:cytochrome c biogenesis protein CcdA/thiol-disulfide isomerase/thioredoxin